MNLKTTIILLLLAAAGGISWFVFGRTQSADPSTEAVAILGKDLTPDTLRRIEITRGSTPVVLEKSGDEWTLPGKWPVRKPEVDQLVGTIGKLHSRFTPIAIADADLKKYGLASDQQPLAVTIKVGDKEHKLKFGEESSENNRFSRPTYVRIDDANEVIRLAPGLIAELGRPQEHYMQRRLFPAERVAGEAKEGASADKVERLAANAVAVKSGMDEYSLKRAGEEWELSAPYRDRPDPDKLKSILTNVPDVWVEKFVDGKKDLKDFGLDKPEQTLKVTRSNGDVVTLLIGKQSDLKTRIIPPPPGQFGQPPMQPRIITEEFKFAKLQDNDQVFEIKADKLKDIAVAADTLRDAQLARFRPEDVTRLEISEGGRDLVFVKDKDKNLWKTEKPTAGEAEGAKVSELLDKLAALKALDKDVVEKPDPKLHGLADKPATLRVTLEETKGTGETKTTKTRELSYAVGKQDVEKNKLYVQVAGWPRVNAVEPDLLKLMQRPALTYRSRKVLDSASSDLAKIEVKRGDETFALEQAKMKWHLATPVQADVDAPTVSRLAGDLGRLDVVEFVDEAPKPEDLDKVYGLVKPALEFTLKYTDEKKPAQTLLVGKERTGKPEFYAKLASSPAVFTLKKETKETLDKDSLSYRPLDLWQMQPDDVAELRIRKEEPEYTLKRDGAAWKISGPFEAAADAAHVKPMTEELAKMRGERYVAHTAKDLATYGLDKPYLRVAIKPAEKKGPAGIDDKKDDKPKEQVLLIGKPTEKDAKSRFAKLGDSEAVFVIGEKAVAAVDHAALELLDSKLLALDLKSIRTLRGTSGTSKYTLTPEKDEWKLTDSPAPAFTADREAVGETLRSIADLRAQKFVAYGDKVDLAKYGLDKPVATVTITLQPPGEGAKPVERTVLLGKAVEGGKGEVYARVDKTPGVVVLDPHTVVDLNRTHLDFVNRSILTLDAAKITGLTRKMGTEELDVAKGDKGWKLSKPANLAADEATVRDLLDQLSELRATRVAAYPAGDVKPFGLDAPAAVVTLRLTDDKGKPVEHALQIGKVDEEKGKAAGDRFARVDKSDAVVVLPGALVKTLLAGPLGWRDRNVARLDDVDRVTMERGPRKVVFANADGMWKMTDPVPADAEQADLEEFLKFLSRLRAVELVADKPADLKPYGLDKPQVRWRFGADGKDALVLLIGEKDKAGRANAKIDGNDLVFLIDPQLTGRALGEYRSHKVWTPAPPDAAQVEGISFGYADGPFVLEKMDAMWRVAGKPGIPIKSETVTDTLDALANLKAAHYVADKGTDLKQYGLDPQTPFLKLELQTASGKRTLHIGRQEGDSKRHYAAMPGEGAAVFVIGEADAARILRTVKEFEVGK